MAWRFLLAIVVLRCFRPTLSSPASNSRNRRKNNPTAGHGCTLERVGHFVLTSVPCRYTYWSSSIRVSSMSPASISYDPMKIALRFLSVLIVLAFIIKVSLCFFDSIYSIHQTTLLAPVALKRRRL